MSAGFLLDTNVPSETLRPMPNPGVTVWVEAQSEIQFISVVTIGELRRGATLLMQGSARRVQLERYIESKIPLLFGKRVLPVTQAITERSGRSVVRCFAAFPMRFFGHRWRNSARDRVFPCQP